MVFMMRTTLDIDDSVLAAAKEIAGTCKSSAGAVISELARKGLAQTSGLAAHKRSGFPVFSVPATAKPLISATVKSILSDEGLPARR
jgi:hypothetical protein